MEKFETEIFYSLAREIHQGPRFGDEMKR